MKTFNLNASSRLAVITLTLAASCVGLTSVSCAADAAPFSGPARKTVQFGDLNLTNALAVQSLYQRIVFAAQQVCDDRTGPRSPEEKARTRICIEQSVKRAVDSVNQPVLTQLYANKTGRAAPAITLASRAQ